MGAWQFPALMIFFSHGCKTGSEKFPLHVWPRALLGRRRITAANILSLMLNLWRLRKSETKSFGDVKFTLQLNTNTKRLIII